MPFLACTCIDATTPSQTEGQERWWDLSKHPISQNYAIISQCGSGGFSKVYKATSRETGELVALKVVYKKHSNLTREDLTMLRGEVDAIEDIGRHQGLPELLDTFEDETHLVLVLELLDGGELLSHIKELTKYSEEMAAHLFRQQLSAVAFLHSKGYIHRDVKPENVLFTSEKVLDEFRQGSQTDLSMLQVKLVDFGLAIKYDAEKPQRLTLGTVGFMSPEVCNDDPNTPAMDMWSLGVNLFAMLCGGMPYSNKQTSDLTYASIPFKKSPGFRHNSFRSLSAGARDLVSRLLSHNPELRLTADQTAAHPWLAEGASHSTVPLKQTAKDANRLAQYRLCSGMVAPHHMDSIMCRFRVNTKDADGRTWKRCSTHSGELATSRPSRRSTSLTNLLRTTPAFLSWRELSLSNKPVVSSTSCLPGHQCLSPTSDESTQSNHINGTERLAPRYLAPVLSPECHPPLHKLDASLQQLVESQKENLAA